MLFVSFGACVFFIALSYQPGEIYIHTHKRKKDRQRGRGSDCYTELIQFCVGFSYDLLIFYNIPLLLMYCLYTHCIDICLQSYKCPMFSFCLYIVYFNVAKRSNSLKKITDKFFIYIDRFRCIFIYDFKNKNKCSLLTVSP